jgi:hypothetical protein
MKKIILTVAVSIAGIFAAQAQDFTLSKGVTVGCSGANPLTDISKKITVSIEGNKGKMILKSMNCSKTVEAQSMGIVNSTTNGTGYYNAKDSKGFIVENSGKLIVFTGKDGKYEVTAVGHTDKKQAKTVDVATEQNNYATTFGNFETFVQKAKEEAKKAEMQEKMLPIPTGDYSDKYGIGGLYYFSEPAIIISGAGIDGKYAQAVLFHFDENDNYTLKAYINDKYYDKYFFETPKMFKAFKEGRVSPILTHTPDNVNHIQFFRDGLTRLEEGLYLINCRGMFTTEGLTCSNVSYKDQRNDKAKNKYVLLSKDKDRMDYLMSHPEELEILAENATIARCKFANALRAEAKPMPTPSAMNTPQLAADATAVTKEFAKGRWAQEVQYAFIIGKEWTTLRNPLTGIITGRIISGVVVMKEKDGSCKWEEISIRQNYDGKEYGKSYFGGETAFIVPVDCNTAMKHKK